MQRVKIKCNEINSGSWNDILKIFRSSSVGCTKLLAAKDGYTAFCNTDADIDVLFSTTVLNSLKENGYTPVVPQNLKAR